MSRFKKYFDNDHYQSGLRAVVICTLAAALTVGVLFVLRQRENEKSA